jgi:intracellular multiplication protein IcmJ
MAAAFYPLNICLGNRSWPLFARRKHDPGFQSIFQKIMGRDKHTCQFCGFQASVHMDVVNIDGNYRNNKLGNLITACPFCSQCLFLEYIGKVDFGGGVLIHLPKISQNQLNALCHVLFCAVANATDYMQDAQNILNLFKLRAKQVEVSIGEGLSDPAMLGQMIIDAPLKHDKALLERNILRDLRVLPQSSSFAVQIEQWARVATEVV